MTPGGTARSISAVMAHHPQLEMARASLSGLPRVRVAAGYVLRAYRPGDEEAWCRLVRQHIGGEYTPETMRKDLLLQPWFSAADLFFAETEGRVVGTSCAQHPPEDAPLGHLHMLAVDEAHRGRGLGRALAVTALTRLSRLDCEAAALKTDDFRLAAIHLYLALGFEPRITHDSQPTRWRDIHERLKPRGYAG